MENAKQFNKDVQLIDGFTLWGAATGGIPHRRQWWIKNPQGDVIGHLDQGCYSDPIAARRSRYQWAKNLEVAA